jgi:hypothetical protein
VHVSVAGALRQVPQPADHRRRRRSTLMPGVDGTAIARPLIRDWLTEWSMDEFIPVCSVITTVLIDNASSHSAGAVTLRLETDAATVTVAVEDTSSGLAVRRDGAAGTVVSGLSIVAGLCRVWGNSPTPSGKTVWAVVGPENRL